MYFLYPDSSFQVHPDNPTYSYNSYPAGCRSHSGGSDSKPVQTDKRVASVGNFSHHIDIFIVFSLWKRIFLQDIFFVKSSPDVITDFHILK